MYSNSTAKRDPLPIETGLSSVVNEDLPATVATLRVMNVAIIKTLALITIIFAPASVYSAKRDCCENEQDSIVERGGAYYCSGGATKNVARIKLNCGEDLKVVFIAFEEDDDDFFNDNHCFSNNSFDEPSIGICVSLQTQLEDSISIAVHLMAVSALFIAMTLAIYIKIKTLRAPEDVAFMISIGCLGTFFTTNVLQLWFRSFDFIRGSLYYCNILLGPAIIVAYFSWCNIIMANQLRKNLKTSATSTVSRSWIYFNHIYGWGFPLVIFTVVLSTYFNQGEMYERSFHDTYENSFKYIPIALLWFINLILLGALLYFANGNTSDGNNRRVVQYRSLLYLKFFLVSGFLWIFELLPNWFPNLASSAIWNVTDCINALQGVYLFVVMVFTRHHVKRSLGGMSFFGLRFPSEWADVEDIDDVELIERQTNGAMNKGFEL